MRLHRKASRQVLNVSKPIDFTRSNTEKFTNSRSMHLSTNDQDFSPGHLLQLQNNKIFLQFLTISRYRFCLEPDMTEASFLLTCCISSTTACLLHSGSPNNLLKYMTILKICSLLILVSEQQYRFFSQLPLKFICYLHYIYFTLWKRENWCDRLFD